eukprot:TRINITY_DN6073_c0_g1_i1.p1 TRINITY_DN6073_c0_g1~~TRINITY_DN6073_c0_g1_i1.p1  ORF type:complete len:332 (-),score=32.60 TRINITY_DN6073_c0_g1_i1:280-1275(-)
MFTLEHNIHLSTKVPLQILTFQDGQVYNITQDIRLNCKVYSMDDKTMELHIQEKDSSNIKQIIIGKFPDSDLKIIDSTNNTNILIRVSQETIQRCNIGDLIKIGNLYIGMLETNGTGVMFLVSTKVETIEDDNITRQIEENIFTLKSLTERQRHMLVYGLTWICNPYLETLRRGLFKVSTDLYKTTNAVNKLVDFILDGDWYNIRSLEDTILNKGIDVKELYREVLNTPNSVVCQLDLEEIKDITMRLQMEKKFMDIKENQIFYRVTDEFNPPIQRNNKLWKIQNTNANGLFQILVIDDDKTRFILLDSLEKSYVDSEIDKFCQENYNNST